MRTRRRLLRLRAVPTAALVTVAVLLGACSGDDGGGTGGTAQAEGSRAGATGSTGVLESLDVEPSERSTLAFDVEVVATEPVAVRAVARSGDGHVVQMPLTAAGGTEHRYPVVGLRADSEYSLTVTAVDGDGAEVGEATADLDTGGVPDTLPTLDVVATDPDRMEPGLTLFDVGQWGVDGDGRSSPGLLVLDEEGEVVWYLESLFTVGDARLTDAGTILMNLPDFSAQEIDILGEPTAGWVLDPEAADGEVVVVQPDEGTYGGIHHEVNPLPSGNILALMRRRTPLSTAERQAYCPGDPEPFDLREDLVVEFTRDGEVVREWPLRDVIDPAEVPGTDLCTAGRHRDWAHANGAVLDEDRNAVVVTARHIDMVFAYRYETDENGPSGELLWSLGPGGTLDPGGGDVTYHPHAAEVQEDGRILVYDNGNGRPGTAPDGPEDPTYSRAVLYDLDDTAADPADWSIRQVWEHRVDDRDGTPLYADFLGDADRLANGNVLIDHGGIGQAVPPARGRIVEVVPTGSAGGPIVFDVWLPDTWVSYRAERIGSLYAGPRWATQD